MSSNSSHENDVPYEYTTTHSPFVVPVKNETTVNHTLLTRKYDDLISMRIQEEDSRVFLFEKVEHVLSFLLAVCLIVAVFVLFFFRQRTFLNRIYEKNKYKYQSIEKEIYF